MDSRLLLPSWQPSRNTHVRKLSVPGGPGGSPLDPRKLTGRGSAVAARMWMLDNPRMKSTAGRAALILVSIVGLAWVAKTIVWKVGTAEVAEVEQKLKANLNDVRHPLPCA